MAQYCTVQRRYNATPVGRLQRWEGGKELAMHSAMDRTQGGGNSGGQSLICYYHTVQVLCYTSFKNSIVQCCAV